MAYTWDFDISLGASKTGLTLHAQIVDTVGGDVGAAITTGFTEIGSGCYLLHLTTIPDGHRGGIKVYESGVPATILAFSAINPEQSEYVADILEDTGTTIPGLIGDLEFTCNYPPSPAAIINLVEDAVEINIIENTPTANITEEEVSIDVENNTISAEVTNDGLEADVSD